MATNDHAGGFDTGDELAAAARDRRDDAIIARAFGFPTTDTGAVLESLGVEARRFFVKPLAE